METEKEKLTSIIIKEVVAKNWKKLAGVKVEFPDDVVYLCGGNANGKTSLTEIFYAACRGVGKHKTMFQADRLQMIGPAAKTADIGVKLLDKKTGTTITVSRRLTASSSADLLIEANDGRQLTAEWLRELVSEIMMYPQRFIAMTPKEQALMLGIDTSGYDGKIKDMVEERKMLKRDLNRENGLLEATPMPTSPIPDIAGLTAKRDAEREVYEANKAETERKWRALCEEVAADGAEQEKRAAAIATAEAVINKTDEMVKRLEADAEERLAEIERLEEEIKKHKKAIEKGAEGLMAYKKEREFQTQELQRLPKPQEPKKLPESQPVADRTKLDEVNKEIEEAKARWSMHQKHKEQADKVVVAEAALDECMRGIEAIEAKKLEYIKGFNLPFKELSISESGELMLNGRYLADTTLSGAEQIKFTLQLAVQTLPPGAARVAYINGGVFDKENLEKIVGYCKNNNIQVIVELPREDRVNETAILMHDMRVVPPGEDNGEAEKEDLI